VEQESLINLTADIVAAHVSNNSVPIGDVGELVRSVHESLTRLTAPTPEEPKQAKIPAVSIRASVKPDYVVCLQCGRKQKTLRRHLATSHGLTPEQYRADFGLPATYPMVSPEYARQRGELARSIGLGRKGGRKKAVEAKAARKPRTRKRG
jgi:predicted transcriptional regulator